MSHEIDLGQIVDIIKRVDREEAIGLLKGALAVAHSGGVCEGVAEAHKRADAVLAQFMPAKSETGGGG